jgi:hypothetical protein
VVSSWKACRAATPLKRNFRFGIITCLMLTVALITVIFYFHPSTTTATLFYRTVPIIPEATGRVSEVNVEFSAPGRRFDPQLLAIAADVGGDVDARLLPAIDPDREVCGS